jgi:outer membrane protein TolC
VDAAAQPSPSDGVTLDADDVVAAALTGHPALCAASKDRRRTAALLQAEDDRRPLRLGADVGASHRRVPTLAVGGVTTPTTDTIAFGTDLEQELTWGTRLQARVEGRYQRSAIPIAPGASQQLALGPGYGVTARLSLEQPLLRGAGAELDEAELTARRHDHRAASRDRDDLIRQIRRDARTAYFALWLADEALAIERATERLAQRELAEAEERVTVGALASRETVAQQTRLAERREAVVAASLLRQRRSRELALLMGEPTEGARYHASTAPPPPPLMGERSADGVARRAVSQSPALAALDAQLKATRARLRQVGESERPALDLTGSVQADGLGHQGVGPAFEQLGTFGAVSAQIGLRFSAPVTGEQRSARRRAAEAEIDAIADRREALRQQIETTARTLVDRAAAARRSLNLARQTVAAAERELEATRSRQDEGVAIAIEVQRAIEALRRARLRRAELRVRWASADVALRELTGTSPLPREICGG